MYFQGIFITPKSSPPPVKQPYPPSPAPSPWWPPMPLVSRDLPILDIPYRCNHTRCAVLCLASFAPHYVAKVHPSCSTYQNSIPFCGWIICYCIISTYSIATFENKILLDSAMQKLLLLGWRLVINNKNMLYMAFAPFFFKPMLETVA